VITIEAHRPDFNRFTSKQAKSEVKPLFDYHVHTRLCGHAEGSMEAYVRSAIRAGLKELCFLDHLTLTEAGRHMSMSLKQLPGYLDAVQQLKARHAGTLTVKAGLEIGYDPDYTETFEKITRQYHFDLIGGSLHFPETIDRAKGRAIRPVSRLDPVAVHDMYFDQLERMLDCDYFDVVCHFDLVKKFSAGPKGEMTPQIRRIISKIKQTGRAVELNTSGLDHVHGEPYPSETILAELRKAGVAVTLGSDAHRPSEVGRHFEKALEILRSTGFTHIANFSGRKRRNVAIN
jgi:histidinol-phosphatase (PHP family)